MTGDCDDLLSAAFDATDVGVGFIAADGRYIRFNPAFCRQLGRLGEELQGQPWHAAMPPEIAVQHEDLLAAIMAGTKQAPGEWCLVRKDGSSLTVKVDARAITAGDGRRCAMLVFTDIENRVAQQRQQLADFERTDHALHLSEERYRQVIEHVSIGIIVVQDGRFRFANPMALEITGYSLEQILNMEFIPLIHEADRAMVFDRHLRRQRGEDIEPRYEFRIVTPEGRLIWVELAAVMIDWDGAPATLSFVSDITKRKQAEDALRRSEGYYRSVIDGAPVGIVIVRGNHVRLGNPRILEMVGFTREEMLALPSFLDCVHEDDRPLMADVARRHVEMGSGAEQVVSFRLRSKNTETVWVEGSTVQVEWEGLPATLAFIHDITPQHTLEENLQRALVERETILETSVVGIALLDAKGRVRWANSAMQQIFALEGALPVGTSLEPYYPSRDDYLRIGAAVSAAVLEGRAFDCELQMRRAGGALLWVHLSGRAVNQQDLGQGTVWVVKDITRRKKLEDELRTKTAEQDAILQSTQIGIALSVDRHHRWINRTFADMMGFSTEELLGKSSRVHFPDEAAWDKLGKDAYPVLARGESYATECRMRRKDGELFWVQLFGTAIDPKDLARGAIWTFVNVTQRRQAEDDIRRTLAQQMELSALKSKFVSMTSHEFRTPLATILSSSELLRHYGDRLPAGEKLEVLGSIDTAVKRMADMLDSILMIGRADSGNLEFRPVARHARQLCLDLANETARAVSKGGAGLQRLDVNFTGAGEMAMLDEGLLRHILGNLIGNAFKYSPAGSRVGLNVDSGSSEIVIEVSDQGIGIPSGDLPRLFDTFHRASNVGNISGTGLGLAIVRRAVELHGGSIEVDSRAGKGSRFTVRLPRLEA
ncbi:MAG: PAS domain S-box protein [Sulfuritalea sp.]|nr:PAS domain S-box protein [Sulfuritalea sp.]